MKKQLRNVTHQEKKPPLSVKIEEEKESKAWNYTTRLYAWRPLKTRLTGK